MVYFNDLNSGRRTVLSVDWRWVELNYFCCLRLGCGKLSQDFRESWCGSTLPTLLPSFRTLYSQLIKPPSDTLHHIQTRLASHSYLSTDPWLYSNSRWKGDADNRLRMWCLISASVLRSLDLYSYMYLFRKLFTSLVNHESNGLPLTFLYKFRKNESLYEGVSKTFRTESITK